MTDEQKGVVKELAASVAVATMLVAGIAIAANIMPKEEPVVEEVVEYLPLNGVFYCEYYKAKTQVVENIVNYETISVGSGWNWLLHLGDGTTLFYTQTAGQFCYVHHVEEEE